MLRYLLLVLLSSSLFACKKSESGPTIDFGKGEGITYRDISNRPAGPSDPTDWTSDATWNQQEQALFQSLGLDVNSSAQGQAGILGVYPNPASQSVVFGYSASDIVESKIVIVDAKYRVVSESSSITPGRELRQSLDLTRGGFSNGQRYRLYYVLYKGSTLYYKGHGDIKKVE